MELFFPTSVEQYVVWQHPNTWCSCEDSIMQYTHSTEQFCSQSKCNCLHIMSMKSLQITRNLASSLSTYLCYFSFNWPISLVSYPSTEQASVGYKIYQVRKLLGDKFFKEFLNTNPRVDIYALLILHIKQVTNENLLYSTGNSIQYSVMASMGRKSKKQGIYIYMYLIHFVVQQKLTQHCTATILQ